MMMNRTMLAHLRCTPLLIVLLLACLSLQTRQARAEENSTDNLPEIGSSNEPPASITPNAQGVTLDNSFDGKRLVLNTTYSELTGKSLGGVFAFPLGERAAGGLLLTTGPNRKELMFNAGFQVSDAQRIIFTLGQLREDLNFGFTSGSDTVEMAQNSAAVSYQHYLGNGLLNFCEINGYLANTPSHSLASKSYSIEAAALYELWSDPRRVAGGSVTGLQGRLALTPLPGSTLKLGFGSEHQGMDYLAGTQSVTRSTLSAEWIQQLADYQIQAGADVAIQKRYSVGLEHPFGAGWLFGVNFVGIRGRDGAQDDNQIQLAWRYTMDGKRPISDGNGTALARELVAPLVLQSLDASQRQELDKINSSITAMESSAPVTLQGYVLGGLGWDDNVTSGPDLSVLTLPLYPTSPTALGTSARDKDRVGVMEAGVSLRKATSENTWLSGDGSFHQGFNRARKDESVNYANLNLGVIRRSGKEYFGGTLMAQNYLIANATYRNAVGVLLSWTHPLDEHLWLTSYLQRLHFDFPDYAIDNAIRNVVGVSVTASTAGEARTLQYGIYAGREKSATPALGFQVAGASVSGKVLLGKDWSVSAGAVYELRNYAAADEWYLYTRHDKQRSLGIAADYRINDSWHVLPQYSYTHSASNAALYDYSRNTFMLQLKWAFRK